LRGTGKLCVDETLDFPKEIGFDLTDLDYAVNQRKNCHFICWRRYVGFELRAFIILTANQVGPGTEICGVEV